MRIIDAVLVSSHWARRSACCLGGTVAPAPAVFGAAPRALVRLPAKGADFARAPDLAAHAGDAKGRRPAPVTQRYGSMSAPVYALQVSRLDSDGATHA